MYSNVNVIVIFSCLLASFWIGLSLAQTNNLLEEVKNISPNDTITKANETIDQAEEQLMKKCKVNAGVDWEAKFQRAKEARIKLEQCGKSFINITEVKDDMEKYRPEGKLDEVFKKYCDKKSDLQDCIKAYTQELADCFAPEERKHIPTFHNLTDQLAKFICHKDGDRIALFIAEKGFECMSNHTENIHQCLQSNSDVNSTAINVDNLSIADLAQFDLKFNVESCTKVLNLRDCVVGHLATCSQQTPSNIAEALFKFVYKATPCKDLVDPATKAVGLGSTRASASQIATAVSTLAGALLALALI